MTIEKFQSEYNIPLGNGRYAQIDLCDLEKIQGYAWYLKPSRSKVEYARGFKNTPKNASRDEPFLHRLLMGPPPPGFETGHKDGNGLNCHRKNLRFISHQHNTWEPRGKGRNATSKYRGVSWNKDQKKWRACICVNKKPLGLGSFVNEIEAAKAYDVAARKHFGEHAAPNFV